MAVAIPVVAAFASGAVGAVVAGTATMAAYATVAGAVLSTVGAITGKKDVMKVGALLSLGGGLGAAFGNGMSTAAASTASSASAADAASSIGDGAAWGATNDIASYGGLESAGQISQTLGQVGQAGAQAAGTATPVTSGINVPASGGLNAPAMAAPDLAQQFATQAPQAGQAAGGLSAGGAWGADAASTVGLDAVSKGAQGITGSDFNSWFQKAMAKTGSALKTTGEFVNKNKGITELGLGAIKGAYGPEAEMVDMKRDELDYQRSLLERARANLNSPIRIRYMGGQK